MEEPKANILLVDDHPENLIALEAILQSLDQNLVKANSGMEALRCLLAQDFAVILLDVQMPDMDGFETAKLIRQRERSRHIPIIFQTAYNTSDNHVFKGYSLGAVDYLFKPIDPGVLKSKVAMFVALYQNMARVKQQALELESVNAELKENEERFRSLSSCSPVGIFMTDVEGRCTYTNPRCQAICGFSLEESLGEGWLEKVYVEDRDRVKTNWFKYTHQGKEYSEECRFQTSDKIIRWTHVRSSPLSSDRGVPIGNVGTIEDITERKQTEAAIKQLNQELEIRVAERTAELQNAIGQLQSEITERQRTEAALRQSKAKFQKLATNMPGMIYQFLRRPDGSASFPYVSNGCREIYELEPEVLQKSADPAIEIIHSDDRENFERSVEISAQTLQPWIWEGRFILPSGKLKWVQGAAKPEKQPNGDVLWDGLLVDITERKITQEALRKTEQKLSLYFQQTPLAVIEWNQNLEVTEWNHAAEEIFGYSKSEAIGRSLFGFLAPQTIVEKEELVREELLKQKGEYFDINEIIINNIVTKSGKIITCEWYNTPLIDSNSNVVGILTMGLDISDRKRAEAALKQAKEAAEVANRAKSDFLSVVSHELRTPLTSVLGFAKIIKKKLDITIFPEVRNEDKKIQKTIKQVEENLEIILSEGERLTNLINDVLDLAKLESGKIEWKSETVFLTEVIEQAIAATSALFMAKSLRLIQDIEPELPPIIGDRDRIIQVLINLISNAVKFTPKGEVICRARKSQNEVIISVIDSGIGIAEADRELVFEKFKQVGDTLTDKPKGTGLGLPICKQILEHHSGRIWVESQLNKGSNFSFALPITWGAKIEITETDIDTLINNFKDYEVNCNPDTDKLKKTILVVDDEVYIRRLLRQQLEAEGYIVREAKNGIEAIAQVKEEIPDLIILDVIMPGMNGFDTAANLKNNPATAKIPIIILSIEEDRDKSLFLAIDKYLPKPINTENLLSEVELLIFQKAFQKKVLIVNENVSTRKAIADLLQVKGYLTIEASSREECIEQAISDKPDMIIIDALLSKQHNLIEILRFEKGLKNMLFFLVLNGKSDDTN